MSDKTPKEIVEYWVYEPVDYKKAMGVRRNPHYCSMGVWGGYLRMIEGQCQRKPKVTIEGYGFCAQHAKIIQKRLQIEKEIDSNG